MTKVFLRFPTQAERERKRTNNIKSYGAKTGYRLSVIILLADVQNCACSVRNNLPNASMIQEQYDFYMT